MMKDKFVYVDSQAATLLDGQEVDISLEYDPERDLFLVEADCERWIGDFTDFHEKYYPDEPLNEELFEEAKGDCAKITGWYETLREINEKIERICEQGSYYDFTWEYTDGTPVE